MKPKYEQVAVRYPAFVADVHVGNHRQFGGLMEGGLNQRCRLTIVVLREALKLAERRGCDSFVVLGDLFDSHRPSPAVIAAVQDVFAVSALKVFLIAGNHDKSSEEPGDNALAPLKLVARVVDDEPLALMCPGRLVLLASYKAEPAALWVREHVEFLQQFQVPTLLATHVGIIGRDTPPWLRAAHDAVDLAVLGNRRTIAGNWHAFHNYDSLHVQCGALVPTGFDNPSVAKFDHYGSLITWEPVGFARQTVSGPRFFVEHFVSGATDALARQLRKSVSGPVELRYLKLLADVAEVEEARKALGELVAQRVVATGVVEPYVDDVERTKKARAKATVGAETFDAAVVAFVKKLQLPEGVRAERVCELAREYVQQGQKQVG